MKHFPSFENYHEYYQDHEHRMNDVDIVENEKTICADGIFGCKSWRTALRRFFKAIGEEMDTQGFDEEALRESIECGCWKDSERVWDAKKGKVVYVVGGYHWSVEPIDESMWYIELTVGRE